MVGFLDAEVSDFAGRLRNGFDWWVDELAEMAAPLLRQVSRSKVAPVAIADGRGYLFYREGLPTGRAEPNRPTAAALVLPETLSLIRETPAPGLSERDWRRILMDEIDRLTPFAAADVYAVLAFTGEAQARTARLVVAPRRRLEDMLTKARTAGVTPIALLAYASDGEAIDLLPAVRADGDLGARRIEKTYWGVVAFLLAANLGVAIWRDVDQTRSFEASAANLRPVADRLRHMRADVEGEITRRRDLLDLRGADEPLTELAALTSALPEGAFAERFTTDGTSIRLAGRRSINVDVAAALRTAGFRQVRSVSTDIASPMPDAAQNVPFDLAFVRRASISQLRQ